MSKDDCWRDKCWRIIPFEKEYNEYCLPKHTVLAKGLKWSARLVTIINVNISHLNDGKDPPLTGYYPLALAAEEPRSDFRTSNYLRSMDKLNQVLTTINLQMANPTEGGLNKISI